MISSVWYLYIALCGDNTFYTGVTTDVKRRIEKHNEGTGAKYTRGRAPIELIYCAQYANRSEAQIEEARIKKLSRKQKELLVSEKLLEKLNE
jgi:putative endonuclease